MTEFDFDGWSNLFKADPGAFQERKYAVLNEIIAKSAEEVRPKLEHTLFRIRMSEERAKSPLQSAMDSSKLMWECFEKMRNELEVLESSFDSEGMQEAAKMLLLPEDAPKRSKKTKLSSVKTEGTKTQAPKNKTNKSTSNKKATQGISFDKPARDTKTSTKAPMALAKVIRFPGKSS